MNAWDRVNDQRERPDAYVECPGCKERVRKGGLRKHQQSNKCQALTLAAFATACGYVQHWSHLHHGVPDVLIMRLRTRYRHMGWGHGGVQTESWVPQWAANLNNSLKALAGEEEAHDWQKWQEQEKRDQERGELILTIAREEGLI